jgi:hypothetical protein
MAATRALTWNFWTGPTRTNASTGAWQFFAIGSRLSTAAKHGLAFFEVLVMLTSGRPWMPAVE